MYNNIFYLVFGLRTVKVTVLKISQTQNLKIMCRLWDVRRSHVVYERDLKSFFILINDPHFILYITI